MKDTSEGLKESNPRREVRKGEKMSSLVGTDMVQTERGKVVQPKKPPWTRLEGEGERRECNNIQTVPRHFERQTTP